MFARCKICNSRIEFDDKGEGLCKKCKVVVDIDSDLIDLEPDQEDRK